MDEEIHEMYGAAIPDDPKMEVASANVDMPRGNENVASANVRGNENDDKLQELDAIEKRFNELEEEAAELHEKLAKLEKGTDNAQDPSNNAAIQTSKEEIDSRSVYVGNVDYACTPQEVYQHFQSCGTINRVTIPTNHLGQSKGFAYVEFLEAEAVPAAILLNESELHGRPLKVSLKRTNIPGMKQFRGRYFNPYMGY